MRRIKIVALAALAALALAATGTSSAQAASTNNPLLAGSEHTTCTKVPAGSGLFNESTCGTEGGAREFEKLLPAGESQEFTVEANGLQKLHSTALTVVCKTLKVAKGANGKGATAPAAGTGEATFEFGGCEVESSSKCNINGKGAGEATFTTNLLKETLVYSTKAGAEKEESAHTSTLIEPKAGTKIVEFELSGECPVTGRVAVEGSEAAEISEAASHKEKHEIKAKGGSSTYFLNSGGKTEEKKAELKLEGVVKLPVELGLGLLLILKLILLIFL